MNNRLYISLAGAMLLLVAMCGCIKNDLPYGKVPLSITAFSVSGQTGDAVISDKDLTVTVNLEETANPAKSELLNIEYKATLRDGSDDSYNNNIESSVKKGDVLDLTNDFDIKLSLFQEYNWKIVPVQNIERVFKVANQMGKPVFDAEQKMALAYIQKDLPLSGAELQELKLGPQGSEETGVVKGVVSKENGWNFYKNYIEAFVKVKFSDFIDETWSIRIYNFDQEMIKADPGVEVAWLYGVGSEGQTCGFEYRKVEDTEWITVPSSDIEMDGTDFKTVLTGLSAETQYVCRAKVGDIVSEEVNFTTFAKVEVPNMGFEDWSQNGKVICPWAEGEEAFWDSGNKGSTTVSENYNITMRVNEPRPGSTGSMAAKLESKNILSYFAAGNLFIGRFIDVVDLKNGKLGFGRSFSSFPTKLTGYYKYKQEIINKTTVGFEDYQGLPDTGIIWIALISGTPDESYDNTFVKIRTDMENNKGEYFEKDADYVLAYGEMNINETVSEYKKFEIELEYRRTDVVPSGILIVCSASKLGDYFTGGVGSTLWVDDFALEYDY